VSQDGARSHSLDILGDPNLVWLAFGLNDHSPDLFLALVLQAIASPLMAAPALAALVGLDATLVLCTMVASTALLPFTAPLFAYALVGPALVLSPSVLGLKLLAILAGSALVGFAMRRIVGIAAIERQNERIEGLNILVLFVFVSAVMESVAARFLAAPMITIGRACPRCFLRSACADHLIFASAGRNRALRLGFMASQRNVGLMLAATGGTLPDLTWLYFAFCYFPLYLSPLLLQPQARAERSMNPMAKRLRRYSARDMVGSGSALRVPSNTVA
jgi:BASS family bile acid:Na+ symporter